MRIEELIQHVPENLLYQSWKVFFSGRRAFESPDLPVYILSMNPGESPDDHPDRSIQQNINNVLSVYQADWSAYEKDLPEGQTAGMERLRDNMRYLCQQLDVHPARIPTSTLIFARSRNQDGLGSHFEDLAQECWRFHQVVVDALNIRVIVCASLTVGMGSEPARMGVMRETERARWATKQIFFH